MSFLYLYGLVELIEKLLLESLGFSPSEAVVRMPLGTVTHKFTHITQTLDVEVRACYTNT